jgi:hypothetical protein
MNSSTGIANKITKDAALQLSALRKYSMNLTGTTATIALLLSTLLPNLTNLEE